MLKEKVLFEKIIDLGEYGDFGPDTIEYKPDTTFATLHGEYTPVGGDTLKAELYVEFEQPVEDPLDILDIAWTHWEIENITVEEWSTDALLNRGKYMIYDLGFVSDTSDLKAVFYPSYLKLNPDSDMEVRFVKAYGTYKFILPDRDEEIFGSIEVELSEHIKVKSAYIEDYLYRQWDNYIVDDPDVLDLIEKLEQELA